MYYRYRHDESLETIARNIISQYDPALLHFPTLIPVEDIMEKVYGLTLEFHSIRKNGRILGETVFEDAGIPIYEHNGEGYKLIFVKAGTVIIDSSLLHKRSNGRFRFTCAHELSHYVIDKNYFLQRGETAAMTSKTAAAITKRVNRSSDTDAMVERQANRLASRILMPKCTLKIAFHHAFKDTPNIAAYLAGLYGVSKQAMVIRLKELGLAK